MLIDSYNIIHRDRNGHEESQAFQVLLPSPNGQPIILPVSTTGQSSEQHPRPFIRSPLISYLNQSLSESANNQNQNPNNNNNNNCNGSCNRNNNFNSISTTNSSRGTNNDSINSGISIRELNPGCLLEDNDDDDDESWYSTWRQLFLWVALLLIMGTSCVGLVLGPVFVSYEDNQCTADPVAPILTIGSLMMIVPLLILPRSSYEYEHMRRMYRCLLILHTTVHNILGSAFTFILIRLAFTVRFDRDTAPMESLCHPALYFFSCFAVTLFWGTQITYMGIVRWAPKLKDDVHDFLGVMDFEDFEDDDFFDEDSDIDGEEEDALQEVREGNGNGGGGNGNFDSLLDLGGMGDAGMGNVQRLRTQ
jgi:hypothetical protein